MKKISIALLVLISICLLHQYSPLYAQNNDRGILLWDKSISRVKILVEKRPELLNYMDENGWTPLLKAVSLGDRELAEYLVGKGADVNIRHESVLMTREGNISTYQEGITPVFLAVNKGNEKILKFLISKGANLNAFNNMNMTPIFSAVFEGNTNAISILNPSLPNLPANGAKNIYFLRLIVDFMGFLGLKKRL